MKCFSKASRAVSQALILILLSSTVNFAMSAPQSAPAERPLWQFGFGAGGGVAPHYPASDQSSLRFLAAPTFRYRGRVLRSDDEGTRARLMKFENAEIDLSGAASFPVGCRRQRSPTRDATAGVDRRGGPTPQSSLAVSKRGKDQR